MFVLNWWKTKKDQWSVWWDFKRERFYKTVGRYFIRANLNYGLSRWHEIVLSKCVKTDNFEFSVHFESQCTGKLCIDWGDGTPVELVPDLQAEVQHSYASAGHYLIRFFHPEQKEIVLHLGNNFGPNFCYVLARTETRIQRMVASIMLYLCT